MEISFPLWLLCAFPLVTGAAISALGRLVGSVAPGERGRAVLHYAGLFGTVMALLLAVQVASTGLAPGTQANPEILDAHGFWFGAGTSAEPRDAGPPGSFALRLVFDRLSAPFVIATLIAFGLVQLYVTTAWAGLPMRTLRRRLSALLSLEAVVVAVLLVDGVEELAAAWIVLAAVASLFAWVHAPGAAARDAVRRSLGAEALGAAAFCLALFVLAAPAPDTTLSTLRLMAAPQDASMLRQAGPFGLVRVELVWALALPALALRSGLWPFIWSVERTRGADLFVAPLLGLVVGVGPVLYLLTRFDVALALAPASMVALAVWGVLAALLHAARALDEGELPGEGLGVLVRSAVAVTAGLVWLVVGMGAWTLAVGVFIAALLGAFAGAFALGAWARHLPAFGGASVAVQWLSWGTFSAGALAFPSAGVVALGLAGYAALAYQSLATPLVNVAAATGVGVAALVLGIAWGRGIRRAMGGTKGDDSSASPAVDLAEAVEPHLVAPALALAGSAFVFGVFVVRPALLGQWLGSSAALVGSFGGAYAVGPRPAFAPSASSTLPLTLVAVGAALASAGLFAWSSDARIVAATWFRAVATMGRWAFRVARAVPGFVSRGLDLIGQLIELGIERSLLDDGSQELRRSLQRPWDRWIDAEARTPGPRRAVYFLAGVALILGWVMFKPEVTTWGPNGVHGFGGLSPIIFSPRRVGGPDESEAEQSGTDESEAEQSDDESSRVDAGSIGPATQEDAP